MSRPVALVLLLLQIVFAALPGDGMVLCVGGEHGPFGLCEEHGDAHAHPAHGEPSEGPAGPERDHCDDCDGVHLTRGALEPWHATAGPDHSLRPAGIGATWLAVVWPTDPARERRAAERLACSQRRAPPPGTQALDLVHVTELRI